MTDDHDWQDQYIPREIDPPPTAWRYLPLVVGLVVSIGIAVAFVEKALPQAALDAVNTVAR